MATSAGLQSSFANRPDWKRIQIKRKLKKKNKKNIHLI